MAPVNSIVGWQFPRATIAPVLAAPGARLLTMDFDFPCAVPCNLRCRYCFVETDERECESDGQHEPEGVPKLTVEQLTRVFDEAAALGCRSAKLVGDQEPLQERGFLGFMEHVSETLGMWVVVFTNGAVLADDAQCLRIHGLSSGDLIDRLKSLRVSIMLKFHSFQNSVEDELVRTPGYSARRNQVLERLMAAGFNEPPVFASPEEQLVMTGVGSGQAPETWTRLGLESVITPQCVADVEAIYRRKATERLYVDLDPPVPVGLTRSAEWRERYGLYVSMEQMLDIALAIYRMNEELGIPFEGASPYLGGLPCSQLPYGLYVNARGRIYPCCGCPETEADGHSEYLGNVREAGALRQAIEANPYRRHFKEHGIAYDTPPFNSPDYDGYGVYHGCAFRDRAGDLLPKNWEVMLEERLRSRDDFIVTAPATSLSKLQEERHAEQG